MMKYISRMRKHLKAASLSEHSGFAITFEFICAIAMITTMIFLVLFIMMVMNAQRYMHTVLTSTAAEASRWGGNNTSAYQLNVNASTNFSGPTLQATAQSMLNSEVPQFYPRISVSPDKITHNTDKITVNITYSVFDAFKSLGTVQSPTSNGWKSLSMWDSTGSAGRLGGRMSMSVQVSSIMKAGALL